jgi:hypothetical protein
MKRSHSDEDPPQMKPLALALALLILFIASVATPGQSAARITRSDNSAAGGATSEAARAVVMLRRLDRDVLVYRSLGEFEENHKLARVSLETFKNDLAEATDEVEPLLRRMPESKLKTLLRNSLDSYRDGAFWWQKIDQRRVVHISELAFSGSTRTSSDVAFLASVPYTVAIHWRQAARYLKRAEETMNGTRK